MRGPSRQITSRLVAGAIGARRDRARQIGDDQAFGAVGDAGERQRAARREQVGGGFRHAFAIRLAPRAMEGAQPAEQRRVVVRRRRGRRPMTQA